MPDNRSDRQPHRNGLHCKRTVPVLHKTSCATLATDRTRLPWHVMFMLAVAVASSALLAQSRARIEGFVSDGDGKPLAGISVEVVRAGSEVRTAVTDGNGRFALDVTIA